MRAVHTPNSGNLIYHLRVYTCVESTNLCMRDCYARRLLSRTSTLVRMLQSRRAFVDFYDLGELKGQGGHHHPSLCVLKVVGYVGTCGSVYEAFCKTTGTPSAVKIISLKYACASA
jgi:hypothetical protein